jgi:hypothetical protein
MMMAIMGDGDDDDAAAADDDDDDDNKDCYNPKHKSNFRKLIS